MQEMMMEHMTKSDERTKSLESTVSNFVTLMSLLALWQVYQIAHSNNFSVSRVSYHRDFVALM